MVRYDPGVGTPRIGQIVSLIFLTGTLLFIANLIVLLIKRNKNLTPIALQLHLSFSGAVVAFALALATIRYVYVNRQYGGQVVFRARVRNHQPPERRRASYTGGGSLLEWVRRRRTGNNIDSNAISESRQNLLRLPTEAPQWELSTLQPGPSGTSTIPSQSDDQQQPAHTKQTLGQPYSTYQYRDLIDMELRLLQIQYADDESHPLEAVMVQLPLLSAREKGFTALSYTWGRDDATSKMYIEGQRMDIRPNLEKILRALRSARCGLLWVDAICINQNDMEERNVQVLRMGGIYAGARNTVVAIKLPDDDYAGIVDVLAKIQPTLAIKNQDHAVADLLKQPRIKQVLKSYCQADYWKRIWIVQEFAIGRRIDLLIGATLIDARNLETLFEYAERMTGKSIEGAEQAWNILDIRRSREEGERTDLFEILEMTQDSLCERRHDRVFGLLGLVSDTLDFLSEPNYQIDPTYLASSMARSYIERRSLDIIILAQCIDVNRSMQLPTWCPPFFWYDQYPPSRHILDRALHHQEVRSYRGIQAWSTTGDSPSSCTFEGAALVSPARRIGRITSLGSTWTDKDDTRYPCHDGMWAETQRNSTRGSYVADFMVGAILDREYEYKRYQKKSGPGKPVLDSYEKYYLVEVFRSKHGSNVAEDSQTRFQRWIRSNRKFSVCGKTLEDHAERCRRTPLVFAFTRPMGFSYRNLKKMARKDMRMMCLDDDQYGIGWAANGARLDDEVFLIPGCSVPLILRRLEGTENYNLIGDAIVIGVMEGEVWNATRAAHLVQVKIV